MFRDYTDDEKRALDSITRPAKIKQGVSARFKLRALKGEVILRESGWSKNLIVNSWFDWLFQNESANTGFMGFVAGAGTATPDVTDTQLQSFLGGGGQFQDAWLTTNSTVIPRGFTIGVRCRAAEGAVVGNVAEIAMCRGTTGVPNNSSPLINRARVLDEMSAPTTVAVASDEILEVIYEFTFYAIEGATGTLTINIDGTPTDFDYEIRPVSMNHTNSWQKDALIFGGVDSSSSYVPFGPSAFPSVSTANNPSRCYVTGETTFGDPSSSSTPPGYSASNVFTSRVNGPYTPGSRTRDFIIRLPLNNGNIAAPGIRSINLVLYEGYSGNGWCCHQVLLDGPFLKPNTHVFDLPITVSMDNS